VTRQQVLQLWLSEGALDDPVVGWAFHDGADGRGPGLPDGEPPYADGVAALRDGWRLLQAPPPPPPADHETGYLQHEFVFERIVELPRP